jgi:hypothetical protein
VAITTSFGAANLTYFYVDSWEVDAEGKRIPLPKHSEAVPALMDRSESNMPTQTNGSQASPIQTQAATI